MDILLIILDEWRDLRAVWKISLLNLSASWGKLPLVFDILKYYGTSWNINILESSLKCRLPPLHPTALLGDTRELERTRVVGGRESIILVVIIFRAALCRSFATQQALEQRLQYLCKLILWVVATTAAIDKKSSLI